MNYAMPLLLERRRHAVTSVIPTDDFVPTAQYVEPDVEVAADTIDVRFRNPIRASVFGVRMSKGDVDSGNLLILQNVSDDVGAGGIGADGKFADAIAVFVGAGVESKIIAEIFIFRTEQANAVILDLDNERRSLEITIAFAQIIPHHTINHENAVRIFRGGENFTAWQVAPFFFRN